MADSDLEMTGTMRAASMINLLAGIWLFISPWVYGYSGHINAWNSWIIGCIIAILAGVRLSAPVQSWVSWINCVLGIWTFFSPWIFGYTGDTGRFVNNLVVGVIVFVLAIASARSRVYPMHPPMPPGIRA